MLLLLSLHAEQIRLALSSLGWMALTTSIPQHAVPSNAQIRSPCSMSRIAQMPRHFSQRSPLHAEQLWLAAASLLLSSALAPMRHSTHCPPLMV